MDIAVIEGLSGVITGYIFLSLGHLEMESPVHGVFHSLQGTGSQFVTCPSAVVISLLYLCWEPVCYITGSLPTRSDHSVLC